MIKATEQGVLLTATKHVWKNSGNRKRTIRAVSDSPFSLISSAFCLWFLRIASDFQPFSNVFSFRPPLPNTARSERHHRYLPLFYPTICCLSFKHDALQSLSSVYPFHLYILFICPSVNFDVFSISQFQYIFRCFQR